MTRWAKASQSVPYSTKGCFASASSRPVRTLVIHSISAGKCSGTGEAEDLNRSSAQWSSWTSGKAVSPLRTRQTIKTANHTRMRLSRALRSLMSAAYARVYQSFTPPLVPLHNPTTEFHFFANSVRSSDVTSRAITSRLRIASSGKISGSSASAAVSSSLAEASTSRAAGTGQT